MLGVLGVLGVLGMLSYYSYSLPQIGVMGVIIVIGVIGKSRLTVDGRRKQRRLLREFLLNKEAESAVC